MRIATWNVNGIRAREPQLLEWLELEKPDIFCLQEIKAQAAQLSLSLGTLAAYDSYFHGSGGYSGVSLHVKKSLRDSLGAPVFGHPPFDYESRIVAATLGELTVASVYVPNGGKDYPAKLRFFEAMITWARELAESGRRLVLAGDLNIAHRDVDVHPTQQRATAVGQRPEERERFDALLGTGLVDVGRKLHPTDDRFFTWWPYWRGAREKNFGWRIDYVLTSRPIAERATRCVWQREFGSSDHAPLLVDFDGFA